MDLDGFAGYLVGREGLAIDTVDVYRRRLSFATKNGFCFDDFTNGQEDAAIQYLVRRRREAGREAFRNDVRLLNALSRWKRLPFHFRQPRRVRPRFAALGDLDVERLRHHKRPRSVAAIRDLAILETAIFTAMRRGELARLRLDDLDVGRRIYVRASKLSFDRWLPVEAAFWAVRGRLAAWMAVRPDEAGDALWCSVKAPHRALKPPQIGNIFGAIGRRAGLPCSTRILRHTRATRLMRAGWDIQAIAYMLGDDPATASIYAEMGYDDVEALLLRRPVRPGLERGSVTERRPEERVLTAGHARGAPRPR